MTRIIIVLMGLFFFGACDDQSSDPSEAHDATLRDAEMGDAGPDAGAGGEPADAGADAAQDAAGGQGGEDASGADAAGADASGGAGGEDASGGDAGGEPDQS